MLERGNRVKDEKSYCRREEGRGGDEMAGLESALRLGSTSPLKLKSPFPLFFRSVADNPRTSIVHSSSLHR